MESNRESDRVRRMARRVVTSSSTTSPSSKKTASREIAPASLERYLRRFTRGKVLVLGDLMLDQYIWGTVSRISPEAPVPVVHVERESIQPGGAANVYHNVLSLGGQARICGVVGSDDTGQLLIKALQSSRKKPPGILVDQTRPTTKKTRIVAHSQQVVRYDLEGRHEISTSLTRQILKYVETQLSSITCIVVSDYCKGVVTPALMAQLGRLVRVRRIPVLVDPKVEHFPWYAGVAIITPNHLEAQQASGRAASDHKSIHEIGHQLRQKLGCEAVLVTRGEQGISLCESTGESWHIPAMARQVYDVTGAGDTLIGTLALALSAGASIRESAILANHAAGVAVGMIGTAAITRTQLKEALRHAGG